MTKVEKKGRTTGELHQVIEAEGRAMKKGRTTGELHQVIEAEGKAMKKVLHA